MALYECVLIARSDATTQQVEALGETLTALITEHGGSVKKNEYWGLRALAYRIKKNRKGHYLLLGLDAPSPAVNEMERQLRLNEDVLRFLTTRVEAIEEGPSAILIKRDRDDRGERGERPRGERGGRGGFGGGGGFGGDREPRGDRPPRDGDSRPPRDAGGFGGGDRSPSGRAPRRDAGPEFGGE